MGSFLSPDSKVYQILEIIYQLFILNIVWVLTSLPLFTLGASTTALYSVIFKWLRKEDAAPIQSYFKAFKANFKQSTTVYGIILVFLGMIYLTLNNKELLNISQLFFYLQYTVLIVIAVLSIYLFPLIAYFDTTLLQHLRNSFVLAIVHFITTILCGGTLVGLFYIMLHIWAPISLFIVPLYSLWSGYFLEKVFKRYLPNEATPEE